MKKFFKIIIVNITFIIISVLLIEFIALYTVYREEIYWIKRENQNSPTDFLPRFKTLVNKYKTNDYFYLENFRSIVGEEYSTPGILLLGCSFTYGEKLKENQTIQYKLSQQTKRPVYNFGISGGSAREMLYILRNNDFRQKLLNDNSKIDYIIYTYMYDQIPRLFADVYRSPSPLFIPIQNYSHLKYKETKNTLYRSYIYFLISRHFSFKISSEKAFKLLKLYLTEIKNETERLYKSEGRNPQFIVLVYNQIYHFDWSELEKENIKVIEISKITNMNTFSQKYRVPNDPHPNEKAWDIIVPALVKELDL